MDLEITEAELGEEEKLKLKLGPRELLKLLLIEAFTGKKIDLGLLEVPDGAGSEPPSAGEAPETPAPSRQGWGVEYD